MIAWHPHTEIPIATPVALIAVKSRLDGAPFLLPDLYRYSEQHACWIGEATGLLLKHAEYLWANETDILETLP